MPDTLSDSQNPRGRGLPVFDLKPAYRLAMVCLGYTPLIHITLMGACVVLPVSAVCPKWLLGLAPLVLYLIPPLVVRATLRLAPIGAGEFPMGSRAFLIWWFTAQWQIIFNRLPFLEEILRLVPGLYSFWLRLWGASVGRLVYWSPGCVVLDRPLTRIGHRVVLGVGARLHAHVISQAGQQATRLSIAPLQIDDDALIGGFSLLTSGVHVHARQMVPVATALPPFAQWVNGRRPRHTRPLVV